MKIHSKLLVFSVVALLLLTFTFSFISSAQTQFTTQSNQPGDGQGGANNGGPPGDVGQNRRQYEKRDVEVGRYQKQAKITSSWKGDRSEDSLRMNYNFEGEYPKITVDYEAEKKNKQVKFSFNLVFQEVFEFVDKNQNGRYDEEDEIVKTTDLSQTQFKNINFENTQNGYKFNTEAVDSSIGFKVQGMGEFTKYGSQILTPSEAKIDLQLNHDFEREDTMLAVKIMVQSQHQNRIQERTYDEEKGYASDESGLKLSENNYSGFFTWKNSAEVDGVNRPVNATFISESSVGTSGGEDVLYLCYQQGSEIVHDPKVGVVGESALSYSPIDEEPIMFFLIVLGTTIGISAAIFYGGIYYRRKRE